MTSPSVSTTHRVATVDLLRGLLMIIMALDHTRDFFSNASVDATDPHHSWPALFFTRWITHLCAPGFVALAGTSVYLQRKRGRSATETASKLVTRGLWLLFVEVAFVSFGIFFTWHIHLLQVIYAIGGSMIVLAALQFLPTSAVAAYGFIVVGLHNLLDHIKPAQLGHAATPWEFLVSGGVLTSNGHLWIVALYPTLPWSGIMALGYAFGSLVAQPATQRRLRSIQLGLISLALFAVLRFTNAYGDPVAFEHLPTHTQTAMSFFDVTKYPPSLQYVCATFGVLLLLFALFDTAIENRWVPRALNVIETYGRVPFFYYVPHFYVIHLLAIAVLVVEQHSLHVHPATPMLGPAPPGASFGLPVVYLIWISVVAFMYLPVRWFAGVKARRRDWWLSYL